MKVSAGYLLNPAKTAQVANLPRFSAIFGPQNEPMIVQKQVFPPHSILHSLAHLHHGH